MWNLGLQQVGGTFRLAAAPLADAARRADRLRGHSDLVRAVHSPGAVPPKQLPAIALVYRSPFGSRENAEYSQ